jgi:hypothetical protein
MDQPNYTKEERTQWYQNLGARNKNKKAAVAFLAIAFFIGYLFWVAADVYNDCHGRFFKSYGTCFFKRD